MAEQLSLAGLDATPESIDSLFFALVPDADAAPRIARLGQHVRGGRGLKGRLVATECLHVSLHGLGTYRGLPPGIVAAASAAAAMVEMPRFDVAFDRIVSFGRGPGSRPLVLAGGDGLAASTEFQRALGVAMAKAGLGRWVQAHFTPHVTLLRDEIGIEEQAVETIGWTVRDFVLIHSLIGHTRHVQLGQWPLR